MESLAFPQCLREAINVKDAVAHMENHFGNVLLSFKVAILASLCLVRIEVFLVILFHCFVY